MIYNFKMDINIRNHIKSLLSLNGTTLTEVCKKMSERTGRQYTLNSLIGKLKRETFSLKEAYILADILGYKIEFIKK